MGSHLYFITGNAGKFREIKAVIPGIEQLDLDLDEIQSLDSQAVIEHKLNQATAHHDGAFIVDDTALTFVSLGELPGPLMKWFIKSLGLAGVTELAGHYDDQSAIARTTLGYRDEQGQNHYFVGEITRRVAPEPRGDRGHGWDPIFIPQDYDQTFAELGPEVKNRISMRSIAARKLAEHLSSH